ncbi:MAG: PQQ-like beta-propeller repeat protein [Bacteroidetes bacterium]|nr:PQQ-like beta-propeller repeat protein [Bacteroidota bacterium]
MIPPGTPGTPGTVPGDDLARSVHSIPGWSRSLSIFILLAIAALSGCGSNEPNAPPGTPVVIRGTDSAAVDERIELVIASEDPAGLSLTYEVDWGDGRPIDSHAGIESGLWFTTTHYYFSSGRFTIRCRAVNAAGRLSDWSAPFHVTISGEGVTGRGDWWMFMRDAQHSGHSRLAGPSVPVVKWKRETTSALRGSVSFDAAGNALLGGDDFQLRSLYPDGALRWWYSTGGAWIRNAPALHNDGSAAFGSSSANVYLLDGAGLKRWSVSVGAPVLRSNAARDDEGNIYVGGTDHAVYSFAPDGVLRWRFLTNGPIEGSPALSRDGQTVYIGSRDQILYAISRDGSLRWTFPTAAPFSGSPSVGPNGEILIGNEVGWLHSLRPNGTLDWRVRLPSRIRTTPSVTREALVTVMTDEGKLFRFDNEGRMLWDIAVAQAGGEGSPAVDVNGVTYIGTLDGRLTAVRANGTVLWRFETGDAIHSTPAIGPDGSIAIGSDDGTLYMLRER